MTVDLSPASSEIARAFFEDFLAGGRHAESLCQYSSRPYKTVAEFFNKVLGEAISTDAADYYKDARVRDVIDGVNALLRSARQGFQKEPVTGLWVYPDQDPGHLLARIDDLQELSRGKCPLFFDERTGYYVLDGNFAHDWHEYGAKALEDGAEVYPASPFEAHEMIVASGATPTSWEEVAQTFEWALDDRLCDGETIPEGLADAFNRCMADRGLSWDDVPPHEEVRFGRTHQRMLDGVECPE